MNRERIHAQWPAVGIDVIEQHAWRVDGQYLGVAAREGVIDQRRLAAQYTARRRAAVGIALGDGRRHRLRVVDEVSKVSAASAGRRRNIGERTIRLNGEARKTA